MSLSVLTSTAFTYDGMIIPPNESDLDYAECALTARTVDGELRFFMTGGYPHANPVLEFTVPSNPNPVRDSAPRATLIRNWGDIYGGRLLQHDTGTGPPYVLGLGWDPSVNAVYWTYSTPYEGNSHNPAMGCSVLNDTAGTVTPSGPWRCSVTSGLANGSLFPVPAAMQPTMGYKRYFLHGMRHAASATCPYGLCLYAVDLPDPGTAADNADDVTGHVTVPLLTLALYDINHQQERVSNHKVCGWKSAGNEPPSNHVTATASVLQSATVLPVSDTEWFLTERDNVGGYYGYVVVDDLGVPHVFTYTGKSTASGPGNLTGCTLPSAVASGDSVFYGNYNDHRGATLHDATAVFNGGGIGLDWMHHGVYIGGTNKHGFLFVGQLADTIPGTTYGDGGSIAHEWYGPTHCPHGQLDLLSSATGPGTGSLVSYGWLYDPAHMEQVALGSLSSGAILPVETFQMSAFGVRPDPVQIRVYGQPYFHLPTRKLYLPEKGQDWSRVGTENDSNRVRPVIHVFSVSDGDVAPGMGHFSNVVNGGVRN